MYLKREGKRTASPVAALTLLAAAGLPWFTAWPQTAESRKETARTSAPSPRALTDQYCVACHNHKAATAGVALDGLDFSNAGANAGVLEKVLRKVRTGEMPPAGLPRPAAAVSASFIKSLEEALDRAAAAGPNPGRPAVHRLNRAEYSNAIRDVLAVDIQPGSA